MTTFNPRGFGDVKVTDRFDLTGKNFLITGGGGGIGFACAKAIAQLGGGIAVIDTAPEPVEEFKSLSDRYGVKTFYTRGDVSKQDSLEKAFTECIDAMGGQLHGAITAAGIVMDTPLLDTDWEVTQRVLNVNVMGAYWTFKLLAQYLVETRTPGSIVAIASINGKSLYVPVQPKSAYTASKAAIKGLMGPLAGELGQYSTRVNCISPGTSSSAILVMTLIMVWGQSKPLYWHAYRERRGLSLTGTKMEPRYNGCACRRT